jgi:hypothetical protein
MCPDCLDRYVDFDDSFAYEFPITFDSKYDDPKVMESLLKAQQKALEYLQNHPYQ